MINALHTIIYAEDAEATRAFFRDVLEFPYVDAHGGWLIFRLPPAELGIHPVMPEGEGPSDSGRHELFLMCDNIEVTVGELKSKGVEFTSEVEDRGFGRVASVKIPGGGELSLYEPRHPVAYDLSDASDDA